MIADYLIENFESTLKEYFPYKESSKNWENEFRNKIGQINHDEPWLTLIACYSIFRNQEKYTSSTLLAVNKLLGQSGFGDRIQFSEINEVTIEKRLPRIKTYQYYLHKLFREGVFHLYPDRNTIINEKLKDKNSYFEGSTHLDLLIQGVSKGKTVSCFIEAKFLSDISYQIDYNPVRDQIIRNIDCAIDSALKNENIENTYFLLLTPKVFRTDKFGGNKKSRLNHFGADSSRLYCYKMDEYFDFRMLKKNLPHRQLADEEWKTFAGNIGWMTFEDMYSVSKEFSLIKDDKEAKMIHKFFTERNLL